MFALTNQFSKQDLNTSREGTKAGTVILNFYQNLKFKLLNLIWRRKYICTYVCKKQTQKIRKPLKRMFRGCMEKGKGCNVC